MSGMTISLGEIERHFWLTRSVARVMRINLSEAMAGAALSEAQYCEMITRCRAGNCHAACERWLASQSDFSATAPEFCANAKTLNALRET